MEAKEPLVNIEQPPTFDKIANPSCGKGSSKKNHSFEAMLEPEDVMIQLTVALKEAGCEFRVMEISKKVSWLV